MKTDVVSSDTCFMRVDVEGRLMSDGFLSLLEQIERDLVNFQCCEHPECDMGVCTHPLRDVRAILAKTEGVVT